MHFEPNYFARASVEAPGPRYERCAAELRAAYARDWLEAPPTPPLAVPLGVLVPAPSSSVARGWAVTPPEMVKLGLKLHRLLVLDGAEQDPGTRRLSTQHADFIRKVEFLLLDIANRLKVWGAELPQRFDWLVSSAGPPTVLDLGAPFLTASYSLEEALEDEAAAPDLAPVAEMPSEWSNTLRDAIRWEAAAALKLTISKNFGAPHSIVGRSFGELKNPFLQFCNVWRSGVIAETRFGREPTLLAVSATRL